MQKLSVLRKFSSNAALFFWIHLSTALVSNMTLVYPDAALQTSDVDFFGKVAFIWVHLSETAAFSCFRQLNAEFPWRDVGGYYENFFCTVISFLPLKRKLMQLRLRQQLIGPWHSSFLFVSVTLAATHVGQWPRWHARVTNGVPPQRKR